MLEDEYWEITGPRKYLNIPMPVPDHWCAVLRFGAFPSTQQVVAWGPTETVARQRATEAANELLTKS